MSSVSCSDNCIVASINWPCYWLTDLYWTTLQYPELIGATTFLTNISMTSHDGHIHVDHIELKTSYDLNHADESLTFPPLILTTVFPLSNLP